MVAALSGDWGYKVACEKFGTDLIDSFPRFSRGPRKSKLKGFLCCLKVETGGWCHNLPGSPGRAGVLRPGTYDWRITMADPNADIRHHAIVATWDYNGGSPLILKLQTPQDAAETFQTHGSGARYA